MIEYIPFAVLLAGSAIANLPSKPLQHKEEAKTEKKIDFWDYLEAEEATNKKSKKKSKKEEQSEPVDLVKRNHKLLQDAVKQRKAEGK